MAATSQRLTRYGMDGSTSASVELSDNEVPARVDVDAGGRILVVLADGGATHYTADLQRDWSTVGVAALGAGGEVASAISPKLILYEADGRMRWTVDIPPAEELVVTDSGAVVMVQLDHAFDRFDAIDGARSNAGDVVGQQLSVTTAGEGILVTYLSIGSGDSRYIVESVGADGASRWKAPMPFFSMPTRGALELGNGDVLTSLRAVPEDKVQVDVLAHDLVLSQDAGQIVRDRERCIDPQASIVATNASAAVTFDGRTLERFDLP